MVNVMELRLGNKVYITPLGVNKVYEIGSLDFAQKTCDNYNPIPLTHEILEKCGFENRFRPHGESHFKNYWLPKNNYGIAYCQNGNDYYKESHFYCGKTDVDITTLHQLQNLYYALTGTELEIKL